MSWDIAFPEGDMYARIKVILHEVHSNVWLPGKTSHMVKI
jgi:hypothetical protein